MSEIKFEKLEHIATLAETSGGYTLEVNLVSWNDKEAKVDIRRWNPQGNPKKGIALSTTEALEAAEAILQKVNF